MCLNLRLYAPSQAKFHDPNTRVPYIGPEMLDEGQAQYIEDVLGVSPNAFSYSSAEPETSPHIPVLVMTPELRPEEDALLKKVLASIKLNEYTHIEVNEVRLGELPEEIQAHHIIAFNDEHNGRSTTDRSVWWSLPSLSAMLGDSPEVVSLKKEAWTFLRQFSREYSA